MIAFLYSLPILLILCHAIPNIALKFEKKFSNEYYIFLLINFVGIFFVDGEILGFVICFVCALLFFAMGFRWKWSPVGHIFLIVYFIAILNFIYPIKSIYFIFFVFGIGVAIVFFSILSCKTPTIFGFLLFLDKYVKKNIIFFFLLMGMSIIARFRMIDF